ncbi:protein POLARALIZATION DURING ASYMMETRIC DIVISION AND REDISTRIBUTION-like [Typha latifolia]|uniref:protein POLARALIZATION DURING ASYMMETRIC DIVISION AND REDISTRIBUTION-like n=1 Tax=Typha latifolia TaxID=4733 RepID=UPI003C2D937F
MVVSSMRRAGTPEEEEEKKTKRVMDYLHEKDDEEDEMGTSQKKGGLLFLSMPLSSSSSSSSPDSSSCRTRGNLMSRWFCSTRMSTRLSTLRGEKKGKGMEERKEEEVRSPVLEMGMSGEVGSGYHLCFSGKKPETASFNFGMGLGLVFVLAKTATEFNKMTELRTQMEMLLKEFKDEYGKRDALDYFSKSSVNCISASSDCSLNVNKCKAVTLQSHIASLHQEGAKCAVESDNCERLSEYESCLRMNELEAELEVELERLQDNLDGEDLYALLGQQTMELGSEYNILESFSRSFGEVDSEKKDNNQSSGVSAQELERRLHELLHIRQQERIAELESALHCAEKKLIEKEIEVCRWKDTATQGGKFQVKSYRENIAS